eukprot:5934201-Amphidinium_carterae.1
MERYLSKRNNLLPEEVMPKLLCEAILEQLNANLTPETVIAVLHSMAVEKEMLHLLSTKADAETATLNALRQIVTQTSEIISSSNSDYYEQGY